MVLKLKASYSVSKPPNTSRDYFVFIIQIKGLCIQCSEITSWNSSGLIQVLEVTGIVSRLHTKVTWVKSITQLGEAGLAGCGALKSQIHKMMRVGVNTEPGAAGTAALLHASDTTALCQSPVPFAGVLCHTKGISGGSHNHLCVLEPPVPLRADSSQLCRWGLWSRSL